MKMRYEKPMLQKVIKMEFPKIILGKGKILACKQCSNCHGCR